MKKEKKTYWIIKHKKTNAIWHEFFTTKEEALRKKNSFKNKDLEVEVHTA